MPATCIWKMLELEHLVQFFFLWIKENDAHSSEIIQSSIYHLWLKL